MKEKKRKAPESPIEKTLSEQLEAISIVPRVKRQKSGVMLDDCNEALSTARTSASSQSEEFSPACFSDSGDNDEEIGPRFVACTIFRPIPQKAAVEVCKIPVKSPKT